MNRFRPQEVARVRRDRVGDPTISSDRHREGSEVIAPEALVDALLELVGVDSKAGRSVRLAELDLESRGGPQCCHRISLRLDDGDRLVEFSSPSVDDGVIRIFPALVVETRDVASVREEPIARFEPEFTEYFATPHGLDLEHLARLHRVPFRRVSTPSEVRTAVREGLTRPEV